MNRLAAISLKAKKIGIDLGTANIVVWMDGKGIVYRAPSIVARDIFTGEISAVGQEAVRLLEKNPGNYVSSRPLRDGVVADYDTTVALISHIIRKFAKYSFQKPYLMICVPIGATDVEKRAVIDAAIEAGAKEAFLIDEPYAAATGAGLPISAPTGNFIVDIGGGTTNIALLSLNGIVASKAIPVGGDKLDDAIRTFIAKKYKLSISLQTAEKLKIMSGSADFKQASYYQSQEVKGKDVHSGLPRTVKIEATDIASAVEGPLGEIMATITTVLENLPPEIAADTITHGIVLTGGGALLHDIAKVFSRVLDIPVVISAEPLDCVVSGIGENLKNIKQLKKQALNN